MPEVRPVCRRTNEYGNYGSYTVMLANQAIGYVETDETRVWHGFTNSHALVAATDTRRRAVEAVVKAWKESDA